MDIQPHIEKSQNNRLRFEKICMAIIIGALGLGLVACFIALYPSPWAKEIGDRINNMKDSIVYFIGLISTNLGLSFSRGYGDVKAAAGQANGGSS